MKANVWVSPPPFDETEKQRRRHSISIGVAALNVLVGLALFILFCPESWVNHAGNIFRRNSSIAFAGALLLLYGLVNFILRMHQLSQFEYVKPYMLDAFLDTDVPVVMQYCRAVKAQGRSLTNAEINALINECQSYPEAYEKVEEYQKKMFWDDLWRNIFSISRL